MSVSFRPGELFRTAMKPAKTGADVVWELDLGWEQRRDGRLRPGEGFPATLGSSAGR